MTAFSQFPLQVFRFPVLVQTADGAPWYKESIRATSWEMAMHRVARDLKPGGMFDIEECPFNVLPPRAS